MGDQTVDEWYLVLHRLLNVGLLLCRRFLATQNIQDVIRPCPDRVERVGDGLGTFSTNCPN